MKIKQKSARPMVIDLSDDSIAAHEDGELETSDIVCTYQEDDSFIIDIEQCEEQTNSAFVATEEGGSFNISKICSHITPEVKKPKKGPSCFNCQGEHQLSDCPEPRDNRRISQNRESFRRARGATRIHEQQQNIEKKEFVPGVISDSLREALGIGRNDIPEWIFRMRRKGFIDGYPPGYMRRAVEKQTLDFFVTGDPAAATEDRTKEVIDSSKMIVYGGFNHFDRKLKDPEKFRIPPWHDFIAAHQQELDKRNQRRQWALENTPSSSNNDSDCQPPASKRGRSSRNVEEGEILDDLCVTPHNVGGNQTLTLDDSDEGEDLSALYKNSAKNNGALLATPSSSSAAGPAVMTGTPIPMSNTISSEQFNHEVMKPDLESWSHNIQPFYHQNIVKETGFYKKVLSIVKGTRKRSGT